MKSIKNTLQTFKLETSVDVPLGVRRSVFRDEPVRDIGETLAPMDPYLWPPSTDPDVWPSPVPVDHNYRYLIQITFNSVCRNRHYVIKVHILLFYNININKILL